MKNISHDKYRVNLLRFGKSSVILSLMAALLISCSNEERVAENTSPSPSPAIPTATPTPYPETYHPGYKEKLPEGAIYKDKQIVYKPAEPTYLTYIARDFIKYTDYFTVHEMAEGLHSSNKFSSAYIGAGQEVVINKVRDSAPNPQTIPKPRDFAARGVYITNTVAGTGHIFKITEQMKKHKLNTVVIDAKDMSGIISYKTKVPLAKEIGADNGAVIGDLKKLVERLHKDGFHVAMRHTLFNDELLANKRPDLAIQSKSTGKPWREGNNLVWVDPSKKEVQDYNIAIAKELLESGVDEIQYDYVRFPAWGNTKDAKYDFDKTKQQKHEIITGYLKRSKEELKDFKGLVSIDVYGVVAWNKDVDVAITGQKLEEMAKHVDIISPMLYPSHFFPPFDGFSNPAQQPYYFINTGVNKVRELTKGSNVAIRPWLQAFNWKVPNYNAEYVTKQVQGGYDAHAAGWLLWNAGNNYTTAFKGLEAIKDFPEQAELNKKMAAAEEAKKESSSNENELVKPASLDKE